MACLAQLINAIAPIMTKPGGSVIKQTIFYPFQQVSTYGRGDVLKPLVTCPSFESKIYGNVPVLQSSVVYNREAKEVSMFILNCDQHEDVEITADFRSFGSITPLEHVILNGSDLSAVNSFVEPDKVKPRNVPFLETGNSEIKAKLPSLSWNMLRFSVK
jgi:alpha-N-arabinofuranosidase